ncbi:MAG: YlxR family protein [Eubacteriales bacterium]|nr:YlxR family protein [Eubacteriales bacterium]
MLKQRKVPMRMCVGCREMKPKAELRRIVKSPEGVISVDRVGKAPGRGAYLCLSAECLKKAEKARALERALETKIEREVYEKLEGEIGEKE